MSTPRSAGIERLADRLDKPLLDNRSYRVLKLPNQLEALIIHESITDEAIRSMDINVGKFSDVEGVPGIAHAVEHLLFMGTEKYPCENEYASYLAKYGVNSNAFTAHASTYYSFGLDDNVNFADIREFGGQQDVRVPLSSSTPLSTQARSRPVQPSKVPVRPNPDVVYEPEIMCRLGKVEVAAFPDMGASRNIVSYSYALRHRLKIDKSASTVTKTAAGSRIKTLGTVSLPFSFAKETPVYVQEFHVLPKCCHNVILGNPFLRLTETFSRFAHRVGKKLRGILPAHRVCFTGSAQQWLAGCANNQSVLALPDTGSDICLMSLEYAQARGYHIDRDEEHRKRLEFVDGSTADTLGLVDDFEWKFKPSEPGAYHPNVYVLEGLHADVLLSYDFLMETQAFSVYAESFEGVGGIELDDVDAWDACFARLVTEETGLGKLGESIKRRLLRSQGNGTSGMNHNVHALRGISIDFALAPTASQSWHARRPIESALYEQRCKAARDLSEPDRSRALSDALRLWQRFFDSRPAA